jgi:hypothetical protein
MFVPFNLSQAIDVISNTYQVEGLIRRFSVGRRKEYKEEEEEGIWEMESIRVFFGSDLSLELRPCVVEFRSYARSSSRPLRKRILSGSVLFLNVHVKGVRNWFDEEIFIYLLDAILECLKIE